MGSVENQYCPPGVPGSVGADQDVGYCCKLNKDTLTWIRGTCAASKSLSTPQTSIATSCHGDDGLSWKCSEEGQYCPPDAPGSHRTEGYCCQANRGNLMWIRGPCADGQ